MDSRPPTMIQGKLRRMSMCTLSAIFRMGAEFEYMQTFMLLIRTLHEHVESLQVLKHLFPGTPSATHMAITKSLHHQGTRGCNEHTQSTRRHKYSSVLSTFLWVRRFFDPMIKIVVRRTQTTIVLVVSINLHAAPAMRFR